MSKHTFVYEWDSENKQVTIAGVQIGGLEKPTIKRLLQQADTSEMSYELIEAIHPEVHEKDKHKCGYGEFEVRAEVDGVHFGMCKHCFEPVLIGLDGTVVDVRTGLKGWYHRKSLIAW